MKTVRQVLLAKISPRFKMDLGSGGLPPTPPEDSGDGGQRRMTFDIMVDVDEDARKEDVADEAVQLAGQNIDDWVGHQDSGTLDIVHCKLKKFDRRRLVMIFLITVEGPGPIIDKLKAAVGGPLS